MGLHFPHAHTSHTHTKMNSTIKTPAFGEEEKDAKPFLFIILKFPNDSTFDLFILTEL